MVEDHLIQRQRSLEDFGQRGRLALLPESLDIIPNLRLYKPITPRVGDVRMLLRGEVAPEWLDRTLELLCVLMVPV